MQGIRYHEHLQISRTLNLGAQILEKMFFRKKAKEIQSRVFRSLLHPLFIEGKLTTVLTYWNGKYFYSLTHNFNTLIYYNEHCFYQLLRMIDLFLVFVDRNFFIQHSFSIKLIFALQQERERNVCSLLTRH